MGALAGPFLPAWNGGKPSKVLPVHGSHPEPNLLVWRAYHSNFLKDRVVVVLVLFVMVFQLGVLVGVRVHVHAHVFVHDRS